MHELGTYNGKPTITLKKSSTDKYGFTFGLAKAKLILDNLEAVRKFVTDNEQSNGEPF